MSYNTILPLAEVKNYLRLDTAFTEDDSAIERMVRSALGFLEKRTNHYFYPRSKTYYRGELEYIDIFDYPISYSGELTKLDYKDKVRFDADEVTVTVGYATKSDVPSEFIDAALQMIKVFYFEAEKQENTTLLPESVEEIIRTNRRFTVV